MKSTRSTHLRLLAIPVLATAFALGCSKRSKSPDIPRGDVEAVEASKAPVNILDHDLKDKVAADIAQKTRLEDGRLRARASVRNSSRERLHVEMRIVFKDALGVGIDDATEWQPVFFSPQQAETLSGTSRDEKAVNFTIEVRKP